MGTGAEALQVSIEAVATEIVDCEELIAFHSEPPLLETRRLASGREHVRSAIYVRTGGAFERCRFCASVTNTVLRLLTVQDRGDWQAARECARAAHLWLLHRDATIGEWLDGCIGPPWPPSGRGNVLHQLLQAVDVERAIRALGATGRAAR